MVDCGQIAAGPPPAFLTERTNAGHRLWPTCPTSTMTFSSATRTSIIHQVSGTEGWVTGFHNALDATLRSCQAKN